MKRLLTATTPVPAQLPSPPTYSGSRVSVAMASMEVMLTFGLTRQMIDPQTGAPGNVSGIEWLASYSLSPTTALQLREVLDFILKEYQKKFGRIPRDPDFKVI